MALALDSLPRPKKRRSLPRVISEEALRMMFAAMRNPLFHIKLTLFVIMDILSIRPSRRFIRWRRRVKKGEDPGVNEKIVKNTLMFVRLQLLIVAIIPLLAVMIARGMRM